MAVIRVLIFADEGKSPQVAATPAWRLVALEQQLYQDDRGNKDYREDGEEKIPVIETVP